MRTVATSNSFKGLAAAAFAAGLAISLGGCAGGGASHYASQPGSNHPFSNAALGDEVFVDGTGPVSRRAGQTVRYQDDMPTPSAPKRAVARSRPLAIERQEARSDAVSGTTGARSGQGQSDPNKPYSDAWWEREKAEDARLKAKMNICRGC